MTDGQFELMDRYVAGSFDTWHSVMPLQDIGKGSFATAFLSAIKRNDIFWIHLRNIATAEGIYLDAEKARAVLARNPALKREAAPELCAALICDSSETDLLTKIVEAAIRREKLIQEAFAAANPEDAKKLLAGIALNDEVASLYYDCRSLFRSAPTRSAAACLFALCVLIPLLRERDEYGPKDCIGMPGQE